MQVSVWSSPSSGFVTGQLYTIPNWRGFSEHEETLAADLNGDGKPDVAVGSSFGIAVFMGEGFGNFAPPVQYTTTTLIYGLALADIRGTGSQDLMAFNPNDAEIFFFRNNGAGTFTAGTPLQIGTPTTDLKVADFNRDGVPDLVFASDAIYVSLGNGDGTFQSPYPVLPLPNLLGAQLAVADFDGDGNPDVASTLPSIGLTSAQWGVLWGEGGGHFTGPAYSGLPDIFASLAAYDVDRDGKPDLVFGIQGSIEVSLGTGNRTFAPVVAYTVDNVSMPPVIVPEI